MAEIVDPRLGETEPDEKPAKEVVGSVRMDGLGRVSPREEPGRPNLLLAEPLDALPVSPQAFQGGGGMGTAR